MTIITTIVGVIFDAALMMMMFFSRADLQKVVRAVIYFLLDYYNALYSGISRGSLHWLPVRLQIDFKMLFLTFEALNGLNIFLIT